MKTVFSGTSMVSEEIMFKKPVFCLTRYAPESKGMQPPRRPPSLTTRSFGNSGENNRGDDALKRIEGVRKQLENLWNAMPLHQRQRLKDIATEAIHWLDVADWAIRSSKRRGRSDEIAIRKEAFEAFSKAESLMNAIKTFPTNDSGITMSLEALMAIYL